MIELFRYIEQAFVPAPDNDRAINVEDESDFQEELRRIARQPDGAAGIKIEAAGFIETHFSNRGESPFNLKQQYLDFHSQVLKSGAADTSIMYGLAESIFDFGASELVRSDDFRRDKQLLNDSIIAVKLVTAFDRINASELVAMRQSVALIEKLAQDAMTATTATELQKALLRPVRIPGVFLKRGHATNQPTHPAPHDLSEEDRRKGYLLKQQDDLKTTYEALMALQPDDLKITEPKPVNTDLKSIPIHQKEVSVPALIPNDTRSLLTLSTETFEKLGDTVKQVLRKAGIRINDTALPAMVNIVKNKWMAVAKEAMPYTIPKPAKVYQVGIHAFAVQDAPDIILMPDAPVPALEPDIAFDFSQSLTTVANPADFSFAITKPVGIGNLQIVRQELLGYEAGEVSHIENVMEQELFRRSSRRFESNELTTIRETETTQMEERDLQSTERNELAKETQKEASSQKVTSQDQTTTTDYGKLVENNKTAYARTVTDRAVNSLTQRVRTERTEREKKTYTENSLHEFDNRKEGAKKLRGIYQWVDKKYRNRIMNYGKRLLYDVVLPEPAAFLMESLKKAQQPESFQLVKPVAPWGFPWQLDVSNYMFWAKIYGVTGGVQPPPDEFVTTIAEVKNDKLAKITDVNFYATKLRIPEGYQALDGYVTRLTHNAFNEKDLAEESKNKLNISFEFFIGDRYLIRFGANPPYKDTANEYIIPMNNEEGELPLLFRTFSPVAEFGFAVGINCKLKKQALEKWQLKTHAAIVEGYRRQNEEYQEQLTKMQASIRTQMALSANYAHNPSIEQEELKKVFISLLMSEHFLQVFLPTPIPTLLPPNPVYYKNWGAMVAFFERAFEWENIMYTYYPYFWGRSQRWGELILIQDINPEFERFLKAGAARVVVPVRPGYEAAMAHYHETGAIWMGKEMPDMFSDLYVSIIDEIKARNLALEEEVCVAQWDVKLPTTLVMLKEDDTLPKWIPKVDCTPVDE
jgi:hypothetical protein